MMPIRSKLWWRIVTDAVLLSLILTSACDKPVALIGNSNEPTIYLVLSREPAGVDSALYALVATAGKSAALEYRTASKFEMRRRSDGALFDWQPLDKSGAVRLRNFDNALAGVGNYRLQWSGSAQGLGRRDLTAGETYDLSIVTDARQVAGSAVLPPQPILQLDATATRADWSKAPAQFMYRVDIATDFPSGLFTSDTFYVIKRNAGEGFWGPDPRIRVLAMDTSYLRFSSDSTVFSYGISGGFGVFTGFASTSASVRR